MNDAKFIPNLVMGRDGNIEIQIITNWKLSYLFRELEFSKRKKNCIGPMV